MNDVLHELKDIVDTCALLYEEKQENLISYLEAVAIMTQEQKAELQRLVDRAKRLDREADRDSFLDHVHEYAGRIAAGEPAKKLWQEWAALRDEEDKEKIDSLNATYRAAVEKTLTDL